MPGNICFIDGQNLYVSTKKSNPSWTVNHRKFRKYLQDKFNVETAYYFVGIKNKALKKLYKKLRNAGFVLIFRDHRHLTESANKGNVDMDMQFEVMKFMLEKPESFKKIVLVTGDGDFSKLVDLLISKNKFAVILLPSISYSSLYNKLNQKFRVFLFKYGLKKKII